MDAVRASIYPVGTPTTGTLHKNQCRSCLHIFHGAVVAENDHGRLATLFVGLCFDCRKDAWRDYRYLGALDVSWRFDFATKEYQPIAPVTVEQLRARAFNKAEKVARWTHVAPDGSRHCCGIAHKERDAQCPAMTCNEERWPECRSRTEVKCNHRRTWAVVALNALADQEDAKAAALWRFAYVLILVEGLRAAFKKDTFRFRNISSSAEQEGVRRLYWHSHNGEETFTATDPEKPSKKGLGGHRKRPTRSGR